MPQPSVDHLLSLLRTGQAQDPQIQLDVAYHLQSLQQHVTRLERVLELTAEKLKTTDQLLAR